VPPTLSFRPASRASTYFHAMATVVECCCIHAGSSRSPAATSWVNRAPLALTQHGLPCLPPYLSCPRAPVSARAWQPPRGGGPSAAAVRRRGGEQRHRRGAGCDRRPRQDAGLRRRAVRPRSRGVGGSRRRWGGGRGGRTPVHGEHGFSIAPPWIAGHAERASAACSRTRRPGAGAGGDHGTRKIWKRRENSASSW
jgi:hypothetical protein